jgi:hypothetical protein
VHEAAHAALGASCSCSIERVPMPRGGKFTTRVKARSSSGLAASRRYAQRVLHLLALEEAQPPVDLVRHLRAEEMVLEDARLGVRR